jgi:DNA-binding beta-propeller fold protein YncE
MIAHPNGDIYVTDGYRNARVHRFTRDGRLVKSWGEPGHGPGQFHLPHTVAFDDDGKLYVGDRSNKRIQILTPEGGYLGGWTGMCGPTKRMKWTMEGPALILGVSTKPVPNGGTETSAR